MLNIIKLFILFILMNVLHWISVSFLGFLNLDLMFVFVMAVAVFSIPVEGYGFIFLSGLFLDFWGSDLFGGYALSFCILAYLVYFLRERIDFENILAQVILVFVFSMFSDVLYGTISYIFSGIYISIGFVSLISKAFFNSLFAPLIFFGVSKVLNKRH